MALPPYPLTFAGFAPQSGKRRTFYKQWSTLGHTLVLFESPHRILPSLADAQAKMGDRPVAVARRLTKIHEDGATGEVFGGAGGFGEAAELEGEFALVVGGG